MNVIVPVIPETAPFSLEQRAWLNGYLAGLMARGPVDPVAAGAASKSGPVATLKSLTILFGSQTGTCEGLAKRAAKEAGKRGFAATMMDMASFTSAQLAQEKNVLVIVSTYGDGEPPDGVKPFHAALGAEGAPALTGLRFSVCALGDTNYPMFCQCGRDFDARLEKLGGTRVNARVDCDLDHDEIFTKWLDVTLGSFGTGTGAATTATASTAAPAVLEEEIGYSKKRPYPALLLTSRNLNGPGSGKQVHHVEFDLAGSGLNYEAGDALGVVPLNCPQHVADVLAALGSDGEEAVPAPDGNSIPLRRALTECYDLGKPSAELLALCNVSSGGGAATTLHHVVDVLASRPGLKLAPGNFVKALKKIQPRLYSISSSPKAHTGQVHLTVGAVRYEKDGRARKGVCSTFLADRATVGESKIGVFVHSNNAFRPPSSGDTPMIMVGPGTGIAPFRAFLHERRATAAKGKSWLFFGDQRAASDFLYRGELESLKSEGVLARLDLAFSRDQEEKIYVQQRMLENAAELFAWLEAGAHFYVCGDASRMAKDVDVALHKVVETAGHKTATGAAAYIQALRTAKRYQRDVY
ncbi:MAG TPA: sulfite reductase subunit alpha [Lacunisphaera sp.]|jgi:sulfite reductase (NADPH) flavoprotein alpha-component